MPSVEAVEAVEANLHSLEVAAIGFQGSTGMFLEWYASVVPVSRQFFGGVVDSRWATAIGENMAIPPSGVSTHPRL